ncbi:MAG: hypothetical protein J5929_09365 [Eubacterium sp.]|nr:hypothetical protein [Eubacterium sp.]
MANIIIKSEERRQQERETLSHFGINPDKATSEQKELASAVNHGYNTAFNELRRTEK